MIGVWLWALGSLACSSFSVSLDQATLQIAAPTPVPTKIQLPPDANVFAVQANQGWQDTGLSVTIGQQIHVADVSDRVLDLDAVVDRWHWLELCVRAR